MKRMIPTHFESLYAASSPNALQKQAWNAFIAMGIAPRSERWKYFDLNQVVNEPFQVLENKPIALSNYFLEKLNQFSPSDAVIVFFNGQFQAPWSRLHDVTTSFSKDSVELKKEREWYGWLNQCFVPSCFNLHIKNTSSCRVVRLIHIYATVQPAWVHSQIRIELEENTKIALIEEDWSEKSSQQWVNVTKHIVLNTHACLYHAYTDFNSFGKRFVETHLTQQAYSFYQHFNTLQNSALSRDDMRIELTGVHANCNVFGLIDARFDHQCMDVHLDILHAASHTKSDMFYKGVLDQQTKSIFSGALHVKHHCNHIVAYQGNHHLLLSTLAQAYSKPELQIYSDQIMCKHGATVGQLDEDILFYLRSRGIDEQTALEIILSSFKEEVKSKLSLDFLEQLTESQDAN